MKSIALSPSGLRETLGALGLPQQCVARLFGVEPRAVRRWRDGTRPIPRGVGIILCLVAVRVVTVAQLEQAAQAISSVDLVLGADSAPEDGAAPVDLDSTAAKVVALTPRACRWPDGEPGQVGFSFCQRPVLGTGSYCAAHRERATLRLPLRRAVRIQLDAMAARVQEALQTPHGAIGRDSVSRLVSRRGLLTSEGLGVAFA
jgi:hypothetical protein